MPYSTRSYNRGFNFSGWLPPGVKWLLIANVAIFLLSFFAARIGVFSAALWFGLIPSEVVQHVQVWRLVTYLFVHGGTMHILWNMLALWMFGKDIESAWGTNRFLKFYFLAGIVAGLCVVVLSYAVSSAGSITIGASGAILAVMVAFGMMYPDVIVFLLLFPIKAKYFVMIIAALTVLGPFEGSTGVSHFAHLGGLAFGFVYMKARWGAGSRRRGGSSSPFTTLRDRYKQWQIERAKKKFEVYMRKHGRGGPWVN